MMNTIKTCLQLCVFSPNDALPARLEEFSSLVHAADYVAKLSVKVLRKAPDPKTYIGSGWVQEIAKLLEQCPVDLVIISGDIKPTHQRNLEKQLCCSVLDRTELILNIFAMRAQTHQGKLQVELAQLRHLSTRLIRGWTHLERQKGGMGLRGPGETQLEVDRRLIGKRIHLLENKLEKVDKQRALQRRARERSRLPTVALVGYTNAGKSTLFNRLTGAEVFSADQLFATLDPTLRQLHLAGFGKIALADTVGFVNDLPPALVKAFYATLEEVCSADLLLHVIDVSDPNHLQHIEDVEHVLKKLGAEHQPMICVYNKVDRLSPPKQTKATENNIWCSAHTGAGMDALMQLISTHLSSQFTTQEILIAPDNAKERASIYALGLVVSEDFDEASGQLKLVVRCSPEKLQDLLGRIGSHHLPI